MLHVLEGLGTDENDNIEEKPQSYLETKLIVDGMAVVNEVMSAMSPKTCKVLSVAFSKTIERRSRKYESCRIIFDNYMRHNPIKDLIRRRKLGIKSSTKGYIVVDTTPISDPKLFLANSETKDSLTLYLAEKVLRIDATIVAVTRLDVKTNAEDNKPTTSVSSQEEADTLIILHAAEVSAAGKPWYWH